jgi:hypothetical protein
VLLSTEAGGTGLNLQVASYVVHLDLPWNPGRLDQRTARAHRMGQTRGVSVICLCAEEGIERAIEGTLAGKRAVRSAALDPTSSVETLEAPSFTVFLAQLQDVLDELAETNAGVEVDADAEGPARDAEAASARRPTSTASVAAERSSLPSVANAAPIALEPPRGANGASALRVGDGVAGRRLALARVVLEAGFAADAVRAAYEALAAVIGALLVAAPTSHAALVAGIYGELLPSGRLPAGAHGALARLHDLTLLEAHGVEVEVELARVAVEEAAEWFTRIGTPATGGSASAPASLSVSQ